MYLANLSNEQKDLFLDLSMFSMESHNAVDKREKALIRQYCEEMKIDYRSEKKSSSFEEVLKRLKEISTDQDLKKITIEILAVMYIDERFDQEEHELLMCLKDVFQFSSHLMGELIFSTKHLLLSYQMLERIVK